VQGQKFIADAMLGKLSRWLRILGYDTLYSKDFEDWQIIKIAKNDSRIILTMDRGLCYRAKKNDLECFYVNTELNIEEILAMLAIKYKIDLTADPNYSRCTKCNGILKKVDENRWKCTRCKKEYWKGMHWKSIQNIIIKAKSISEKYEFRTTSNNQ